MNQSLLFSFQHVGGDSVQRSCSTRVMAVSCYASERAQETRRNYSLLNEKAGMWKQPNRLFM